MKIIKLRENVIQTRTDYSQSYRFRLWVVLVEDMALLKMAHHAYYTHIFECFKEWESEEFLFLNAKGQKLNIGELRKDDLFGFLGAKSATPRGPKRKIHGNKFAVLDAFIRKKHPFLAPSLVTETPIVELASILKIFFFDEDGSPDLEAKRQTILERSAGILVADPESAKIWDASYRIVFGRACIPVIF